MAQEQIKNFHYDSAIAFLRAELSGIDWDDDSESNPTLENDSDLHHAINACMMAKWHSKDNAFRQQALENINYLINGNRDALTAMEERHALIARIEMGLE